MHIVHNVVGYVEISVLQLSLTHYDKRERIISFPADELMTFTLKGSTWDTYSISTIHGLEPLHSSMAHSLRKPGVNDKSRVMRLTGESKLTKKFDEICRVHIRI